MHDDTRPTLPAQPRPLVEAAEVDRDRDITAALIHAAADFVSMDDPPPHLEDGENHKAAKAEALAFLRGWWRRKAVPPVELPRF